MNRVLSDIETVYPQKSVSVTFKNLLPVNVIVRVVSPVVELVDSVYILEMFMETVIFDNYLMLLPQFVGIDEQEVDFKLRPSLWPPIGSGFSNLLEIWRNRECRV